MAELAKSEIKSYGSKFYYCNGAGGYSTVEDLAKPDFKPCITNKFEIRQGRRVEPFQIVYDPFVDELRVASSLLTPLVDTQLLSEDIKHVFRDHEPEVYKEPPRTWGQSVAIGHNAIATGTNTIAIGYGAIASSNSIAIGCNNAVNSI